MCQVIPFTVPCCRRIYVDVSKLPSCPEEWPRRKCPADLCIQVGESPEERQTGGACWRCKALEAGIAGVEREEMRPAIDKALIVEGLEEYDVEGRKHNVEKQGNCWCCNAKIGCTSCGSTKKSGPETKNTSKDDSLPSKKRKRGAVQKAKGPVARIKQEAGVDQKQTPPPSNLSPTRTRRKQSDYVEASNYDRQRVHSFPLLGPAALQMLEKYPRGSEGVQPSFSYPDPSQVSYLGVDYPASHKARQPSPSFAYPSSDAASGLQAGYPHLDSSDSSSAYPDPSQLSHFPMQDYINIIGNTTRGVPKAKSENTGENVSHDGFLAAWHIDPESVVNMMAQAPVSQYPDPEDLSFPRFKAGYPTLPEFNSST